MTIALLMFLQRSALPTECVGNIGITLANDKKLIAQEPHVIAYKMWQK